MTMQTCDSCEIGGVTYYFADFGAPAVQGTAKVVEAGQYLMISGCWRGYVGKWRVESGGLYLDAINGKYALADGNPVLADWITGKFELTSIPNPGWFPSEVNTTYEILVTEGVVWGFRQLPEKTQLLPDSDPYVPQPMVEHKYPTRFHALMDRVLSRLIPERSLKSRLED